MKGFTMTTTEDRKVLTAWKWIDGREPYKRDPLAVDNTSMQWGEPEAGRWYSTHWHQWVSNCGRYKLMRLQRDGGEVSFAGSILRYVKFKTDVQGRKLEKGMMTCFWDSVQMEVGYPGYPKYFKSLRAAIEAVERRHLEDTKTAVTDSNREEVIIRAKRDGLEIKPTVQTLPSNKIEGPIVTEKVGDPKAAVKRTRIVSGELDALGSRIGSGEAKINEKFSSTTPKSLQQLCDEAGIATTISMYYRHLKRLLNDNLIVKTGSGYMLSETAKV
jgi:hypothetical protein